MNRFFSQFLARQRKCLFTLGCLLFGLSCGEIETFVPAGPNGGPAGAVTGQLVYSGPAPCTRAGRIVGSAILTAFERGALPPPDGLGRTALGMTVLPGEKLFAPIRQQLSFNPKGDLWCPAADAPPVLVGTDWQIAPLGAGEYQIRGFYDRDGDFNPALLIAQLPTQGDIAGGAISNLSAAQAGAPVLYTTIGLGALNDEGRRVIGEAGARVDGVTVTLALPLPVERPVFHFLEVLDRHFGNVEVDKVRLPSDHPVAAFDLTDPVAAENSFVRLRLGASVGIDERMVAPKSPFFLPTEGAHFAMSRDDVDRNGVIDAADHIPETSLLPSLMPLGLLTKLTEGSSLTMQTAPLVVMQALTLYKGLAETAQVTPDFAEQESELLIALRPAVLCIDDSQAETEMTLLLARERDETGAVILQDTEGLKAGLAARFDRPVRVTYGCLPRGHYATNIVYSTGQAWTVPNEAGVCAATEAPSEDGTLCGSRARLASQSLTIEIGPPTDPVYCEVHPTPSACLP